MKECTDLCDKHNWCVGTEYLIKNYSSRYPKGGCLLNNNKQYPIVKDYKHHQYACYKNNKPECPSKYRIANPPPKVRTK